MINFQHNHFELFGLPQRFHLDLAQLDQAYRGIQSQVHPDRIARASDTERRVSMQSATQVNEAYRTLKNPLARARYLLSLQRVDIDSEEQYRDAGRFPDGANGVARSRWRKPRIGHEALARWRGASPMK